MINETQQLRRSQFILTYGPGSIIETKYGPRLILGLKYGLGGKWKCETLEQFEIQDVRLCNYLNKMFTGSKCRIFALPSNASLGIGDKCWIYKTSQFPRWNVCYNTKNHQHPLLYDSSKYGSSCPECKSAQDSSAVRFVAVCPNGHLDEINWSYAVHSTNNDCDCDVFDWIATGSSLDLILIKCRKCGKQVTMADVYKLQHHCRGRFPEKGGDGFDSSESCNQNMSVTQRQSSSLRIAETITLLTIPKYDDQISRILQQSVFRIKIEVLIEQGIKSKDEFIRFITNFKNVPDESKEIIITFIHNEGIDAFFDKYYAGDTNENKFIHMMDEEYHSLINGSGDGSSKRFCIGSSKTISSSNKLIPDFQLFPVFKVRTVTVQKGYIRQVGNQDDNPSKVIQIAEKYNGEDWFPGYEGFGEGLFLNFDEESLKQIVHGKAYSSWNNFKPKESFLTQMWSEICTRPEFVWLHTLSHTLIRAISEYAGYSVASMRERVYYDQKECSGGILIYNTSAGDDGSMGGLISLTESFGEIVKRGLELLVVCSNDPLCLDVQRKDELVNGAACYGCLLISETSCEHGNKWLDRHLFLDGV